MKKNIQIIKNILPGLIPILFFVIADEIWGTQVGIIVAVGIGLFQLIYFGIKEKKLEKFVLFDTLLIIIMGIVSIILKNDIFFKLKPVIIELILIGFLLFSLFSKHNIIANMSKRYVKELEITETQNRLMKKNIIKLLYLISAHLLLTIYSCFWMSTEAWAFISTALLYIIIIVYFSIEFLLTYIKNKNIEYLPVINENGQVMGKASREECHKNHNLIYPVVRLHLFNENGEILLQRRSLKSDIEPGKWDAAVAGHVHFGEEIETAIKRECAEELNYKLENFKAVNQRLYKAPLSTSMIFMFAGKINLLPKANYKELEEVKFYKLSELNNLFISKLATKALEEEYPILLQLNTLI